MDPTFVSLAVGAFVLAALLGHSGRPRPIRPFRGPMWGSAEEAQWEHLRHFTQPQVEEEEEDD